MSTPKSRIVKCMCGIEFTSSALNVKYCLDCRAVMKKRRTNTYNEKRKMLMNEPEIAFKAFIYSYRGMDHMSFEEFLTFENRCCNICGSDIDNSFSIKRINSNKAPTIDNVIKCCKKCKAMSMVFNLTQVIAHAKVITMHQESIQDFNAS